MLCGHKDGGGPVAIGLIGEPMFFGLRGAGSVFGGGILPGQASKCFPGQYFRDDPFGLFGVSSGQEIFQRKKRRARCPPFC